uniref:Putative secreted protein n=1 Tax=Ixodes ricinus TaxID=34613 RepID=A0A6B0U622_IXORI
MAPEVARFFFFFTCTLYCVHTVDVNSSGATSGANVVTLRGVVRSRSRFTSTRLACFLFLRRHEIQGAEGFLMDECG